MGCTVISLANSGVWQRVKKSYLALISINHIEFACLERQVTRRVRRNVGVHNAIKFWRTTEIFRVGDKLQVPLPLLAFEHQYAITQPLSELSQFDPKNRDDEAVLPFIRDLDRTMYYRNHWSGLGVGSYWHKPLPVDPYDLQRTALKPFTPNDFEAAKVLAEEMMPPFRGQPLATRQGAARALGAMNLRGALPQVLAVLKDTKEAPQALNLWRALLSNKGAGNILAGSVLSVSLPKPVVTAGIRAAREGGRNEKALVSALARSQNIALLTKQMNPAELEALAGRAMKEGDPFAGEKIYRRAELACTICHAIGGAGGKVGPDFTSLGTSAQPDYIIESLWYPNRKIKEGYHTTVVETKDGRALAGVQVRDAGGELVLRDLANKLVSIPKNQIRKKNVGLSLMTPGLIAGLAEDEQLHLYRFLAELGKAGPFDATKTGVARTWKLLPGTHRVEEYGIEKIVEVGFDKKWSNHVLGVGNNAGWSTLPARVNGDLPSADMLNATVVGRHVGLVHIFAGTNFQVQKAGKVTFRLPAGLKTEAWVNGKPLKRGTQFTTELKPGKHRIVIRLDAKALPKVLRLESKDVAFLNN